MKKRFSFALMLLIVLLLGFNEFARSEMIPQKGSFKSRFLIVIDKESYEAAKEEVLAYKSVLVEEGLGATLLIGQWINPESLRAEIKKLYDEKPVLEGAVLIGKIPVVRIRNFQHATTAFKMDEVNYPMTESSVTSDRYYDDLDLEFEFIEQDKKSPADFYFRLKESSPQVVRSNFYSARMMPPSDMGIDPVVLLKRYLKKVVAAHKEKNPLDQLVIFNGHGYNSDCLTAWQNEQFAIREQLPLAFKSSKGNGFYNFRQDPVVKYKLYDKMQQPGTDLFIFHEHGDFDTQYINGDYPSPNILEVTNPEYSPGLAAEKLGPMSTMAIFFRNTYRRYKGERKDNYKKSLIAEHGLTEAFFAKERLDSTRLQDSIFAADVNIVLSDLKKIKMQPKFSIFDACYNGSFHKPGYIAGYHVFGEGNTIVAQGNTVNVLQDKWSLELLGMLAEGVRIGFWQKEVQYLESHLIGDPTYHFHATDAEQLNVDLATKTNDTKLWETYLTRNNPNLQALALKQLAKNPPIKFSSKLLDIYSKCEYYSVRMEAFKRLLDVDDENRAKAILAGLNDPYELIRRFAARFAGYSGDPILIAPLVNTVLFSNESQRVQYAAQSSLQMFDIPAVIAEIERQVKASNLSDKTKTSEELTTYFKDQLKYQEKSLRTILDKSAKLSERLNAVRSLRNYNNHKQVRDLLIVLNDSTDDSNVRTVMAEALGWFNWSIRKAEIVGSLNRLYPNTSTVPTLHGEVLQSIKRLSD